MPVKTEPRIITLHQGENIHAIIDERGNTIGTGTREVCEVLLFIITRTDSSASNRLIPTLKRRSNVRSAIAI